MAPEIEWEYQVFTVGSHLRGLKDEEMGALLTNLAADGWEIINVDFPGGSRPKVVARRPMPEAEKRKRSWPSPG